LRCEPDYQEFLECRQIPPRRGTADGLGTLVEECVSVISDAEPEILHDAPLLGEGQIDGDRVEERGAG